MSLPHLSLTSSSYSSFQFLSPVSIRIFHSNQVSCLWIKILCIYNIRGRISKINWDRKMKKLVFFFYFSFFLFFLIYIYIHTLFSFYHSSSWLFTSKKNFSMMLTYFQYLLWWSCHFQSTKINLYYSRVFVWTLTVVAIIPIDVVVVVIITKLALRLGEFSESEHWTKHLMSLILCFFLPSDGW